jgi:hypothetical protein
LPGFFQGRAAYAVRPTLIDFSLVCEEVSVIAVTKEGGECE